VKTKYHIWSYCLFFLCTGISSYSLYSNIQNTWLIAPPIYILLILIVAAIIFGILGLKKTKSLLAVILSAILFSILIIVLIFESIFSGYQGPIQTIHSPNKNYTINFYRWDAGAMGTFGVRGELEGPLWFKKRIYNEARVESVDVKWVTNDTVSINDHVLNLDKEDTYGY
jgi:hypothetical protein